METLQKPRKKTKTYSPKIGTDCPFKDPIIQSEAVRIMNLTYYETRILFARRKIPIYQCGKYSFRSLRDVMNVFLWKYGDKGSFIDFLWAQKILGEPEEHLLETLQWEERLGVNYCTAKDIYHELIKD